MELHLFTKGNFIPWLAAKAVTGLDLNVPLELFSLYVSYIVPQDGVAIMVIILPLINHMSLIFMAQNLEKR